MPPKAGENRVVFLGDQITENWGRGEAEVLPRQAVSESRHRAPDHAADAGAIPPGRDRAEVRKWWSFRPALTIWPVHRPVHGRHHGRELHVDGGTG